MKISDIKKNEWVKGEEWFEKWYNAQLCLEVMNKNQNPIANLFTKTGVNILILNSRWFYERKGYQKRHRDEKRMAEGDIKDLKKIVSASEKYLNKTQKIIIRAEKATEINIELLKEIKLGLIYIWYVFLVDLGQFLGEVIDQRLKKLSFTKKGIETIKEIYANSNPPLSYQIEEKNLIRIANLYKKLYNTLSIEFSALDPKLKKAIERHCSKFNWTSVNEIDVEPSNAVDYLEKIKGFASDPQVNRSKPKNQALKKLDTETRQFLKIAYHHIYLDNYSADLYAKLDFLMQKLIHDSFNVSFSDQSWYSFSEIENLIKNGIMLSKAALDERKKHRIMIQENGTLTTFYNPKYFNKLIIKLDQKILNKRTLRGQIACLGFTKGIVKIIKGVKDVNKVEKGDILVATTTRPDLMVAIRKCAAIITDHGGITSHAAIVSREFKIPCIVGTKVATEILKDGDLVMVDANKGIVRILT